MKKPYLDNEFHSTVIYKLDRKIMLSKESISTKYIIRDYDYNYKAIYFDDSNNENYINYWFHNHNTYCIKSIMDYNYNKTIIYGKNIFFLYNFKYMILKNTNKKIDQRHY
jgi:hypothetical protein